MRVLLLCLLSLLIYTASAQPGGVPPPDPGPPVPFSGIEILLVAGAALGFKKIINYKKSR